MKFLLLFALGLTAAAAAAQQAPASSPPPSSPPAQTSESSPPPLPPGPLLNPIPDFYQWTIVHKGLTKDSTAPKPAPGKPDYTNVVIGQKTGDIIHLVSFSGNGNKMEIWQKGAYQVIMNTGWKIPAVSPGSADERFTDISWVSAANFTGIKKLPGHGECMYFKDKILPRGLESWTKEDINAAIKAGENIEGMKIPAVACIEVERRLPVAMTVGQEATTYKFEPLKAGIMLTFPANAQAAIAAQNQQIQATMRRPVRP